MKQNKKTVNRRRGGFTLLEMMISTALLVVIGLLGFVATSSSYKSVDLNQRMSQLQQDVRDTMRAVSDEVQKAVKPAKAGMVLPVKAQALKVADAKTITFVTPTDMTFTKFTGVQTIQFQSEDTPAPAIEGGEFGNAKLDAGEDKNNDGALTRQLVLTRDNGTKKVLGAANHLANVQFALSADGTTLAVTVVASTPIENNVNRVLQFRATSNIYLMN
jgi:prepilin-type N-terminal cleavage/methylation domain-containing protein